MCAEQHGSLAFTFHSGISARSGSMAAALKRKTVGGWSYDDVDENISESVACIVWKVSLDSARFSSHTILSFPAPFLLPQF
jgi:hypothetical protein